MFAFDQYSKFFVAFCNYSWVKTICFSSLKNFFSFTKILTSPTRFFRWFKSCEHLSILMAFDFTIKIRCLCLQKDFNFKPFLITFEIVFLLIFRDFANLAMNLGEFASMFRFNPLQRRGVRFYHFCPSLSLFLSFTSMR